MFSPNPPVRELTNLPEKPEEVWVVQINPSAGGSNPEAMPEIIDRRNELSGNLSFGQELYVISKSQ